MTTSAIPETLTALIGARLDALDHADRALLLDAAVLGQSFTPEGSPRSAARGLAGSRLGWTRSRDASCSRASGRALPERGQYAFMQALVRETAYNTLAGRIARPAISRRRAASRRSASRSSSARSRGTSSPPAPSPPRARRRTRSRRRRGSRCARLPNGPPALGSNEQALGLLGQALAVTTSPADQADLLELAGDAAAALGHHEAAERHLRAAIDARTGLGDRPGTARATAALGRSLSTSYRTADAIAVLVPAVESFADLADDPAVIGLEGQLARAYFLADDNRRAIEVAERVLEAAEHADLVAIVADTLITKGTALGILGRGTEGLGVLGAGASLAEAHDLSATLMRAYINLSFHEANRDPRASLNVLTNRPGPRPATRRNQYGHGPPWQ